MKPAGKKRELREGPMLSVPTAGLEGLDQTLPNAQVYPVNIPVIETTFILF